MAVDSWSAPALLGLGLVFGLKHALDADHLAAVATLASEKRTLLQSGVVGAVWGFGHTVALLVVGVAVLLLRVEIDGRVTAGLELAVAAMLVALGLRSLWRVARGGRIHVHAHEHDGWVHVHPHLHDAEERRHRHDGHRRPFAVGLVHGLAGSGALMLLVAASTPSPWTGLAYIISFGVGSIGGMIAMSALVSVPAVLTAERFRSWNGAVGAVAGVLSIAVGIFLGYESWHSPEWL